MLIWLCNVHERGKKSRFLSRGSLSQYLHIPSQHPPMKACTQTLTYLKRHKFLKPPLTKASSKISFSRVLLPWAFWWLPNLGGQIGAEQILPSVWHISIWDDALKGLPKAGQIAGILLVRGDIYVSPNWGCSSSRPEIGCLPQRSPKIKKLLLMTTGTNSRRIQLQGHFGHSGRCLFCQR